MFNLGRNKSNNYLAELPIKQVRQFFLRLMNNKNQVERDIKSAKEEKRDVKKLEKYLNKLKIRYRDVIEVVQELEWLQMEIILFEEEHHLSEKEPTDKDL